MRKGISPIVAVVLLIAIAVIAAVAIYFFMAGMATRQATPNVPVAITAIPIGNGKILIANLGSTPLNVNDVQSNCESITPATPGTQIGPNEQGGPFTLVNCPDNIIIYGARIGTVTLQTASVFGTMCPSECGTGEACTDGGSCASGNCTTGVCRPDCTNTCENGEECALPNDCFNNTCVDLTCRPSCRPTCPDGNDCVENDDCFNNTCTGNVCQPGPTCGNNIQEGAEECDLLDLDAQTCITLGHDNGTLACFGNCTFNETACCDATQTPELSCSDGLDNDCDGYTDEADLDCSIGWYHTYASGAGTESIADAIVDAAGNYVAVGTGDWNADGFVTEQLLTKYDGHGNILLDVYYNGDAAMDTATSVVDSGDGYGIAGKQSPVGLVYSGTIMKADKATGNAIWGKSYSHTQFVMFNDIIYDAPSFVVVGNVGPGQKFFAMKVSAANGAVTWAKNYSIGGGTGLNAIAIVNDMPNNQYVVVAEENFGAFNDIVVFGINKVTGNPLWNPVHAYAYGDAAPPQVETPTDILLAPAGAAWPIIVTGQAWGGGTANDAMLLNLNATGYLKLGWLYNDGSIRSEIANSAIVSGANLVVTGSYTDPAAPNDNEIMLFETDNAGNLLWDYYYPDAANNQNEYAYAVGEDPNYGFVVAGTRNTGQDDLFLVRTYENGTMPVAECVNYVGDPGLGQAPIGWSPEPKSINTEDVAPVIVVTDWNLPVADQGLVETCLCEDGGC